MGECGFFGGSFDPFTVAHKSVVDRAVPLFSRLVIGIGVNSAKRPWQPVEERLEAIRRVYAGEPKVEVVVYDDLTVDAARRHGAKYLLRGARTVADFEYERSLADINRNLSGLESVLIYTLPEHSAISSSMVRELAAFGRDISPYLP